MLLSSIVLFLLAAILFAGFASSLALAQQIGATTTTTTPPSETTTLTAPSPSPPLTPEEQEQQNRLQNVIAATNQNLDEAEKQIGGIVHTPRWSDVVWVNANSLAVLIAYCLPGEFAESGQEILGGFELEALESYEIALPQGFMAWMMVIGNEDQLNRLPAAVGVICASDLNDAQTRVLSPQEQQQINNVISQFTTQVTNIDQVINIINNVTVNATVPVTPPPPPPTNDTGGNNTDTTSPVVQGPTSIRFRAAGPEGAQIPFGAIAEDNVDGAARLDENHILTQDDVGGFITISCDPPSGSVFPIGVTTGQCTAVDQAGNTGTYSFTFTVTLTDTTPPILGVPTVPPIETNNPAGALVSYSVEVGDDVDGAAALHGNNLIQDDIGGDITISCDPPSGIFQVGATRVQCTAVDASGNVAAASFTVTVELSLFSPPRALEDDATAAAPATDEEVLVEEEEQPPPTDEGAAPPVEEEPATEEEEAATTPPPANEGG